MTQSDRLPLGTPPQMATDEQRAQLCALFVELVGNAATVPALRRWLERAVGASDLRFLDGVAAEKALAQLAHAVRASSGASARASTRRRAPDPTVWRWLDSVLVDALRWRDGYALHPHGAIAAVILACRARFGDRRCPAAHQVYRHAQRMRSDARPPIAESSRAD